MAAPSPRKTTKRTTAPRTAPAAVEAVPQTTSRTYRVVDDILFYTTKAGFDLTIDLDFPPELIQLSMGALDEDRDEAEQFDVIAQSYGENFEDAYKKMGVLERKRLQRAVFDEFQKAMGITMGESSGSSRS